MIGYLKGEVIDHEPGKVLLFVGENVGGVGYQVTVPQSIVFQGKCVPGTRLSLFIYTHVREEALDLYGFLTAQEKKLFLTLLSVNGIGPKGAITLLSVVDPVDLTTAILRGDQEFLVKVPGIGKKTAERVIVELKDVIRKKMEQGEFGNFETERGSGKKVEAKGVRLPSGEVQAFRDAKGALVSLGYREPEVHSLLNRILEDLPSVKSEKLRVEDLIRVALKQLASGVSE